VLVDYNLAGPAQAFRTRCFRSFMILQYIVLLSSLQISVLDASTQSSCVLWSSGDLWALQIERYVYHQPNTPLKMRTWDENKPFDKSIIYRAVRGIELINGARPARINRQSGWTGALVVGFILCW